MAPYKYRKILFYQMFFEIMMIGNETVETINKVMRHLQLGQNYLEIAQELLDIEGTKSAIAEYERSISHLETALGLFNHEETQHLPQIKLIKESLTKAYLAKGEIHEQNGESIIAKDYYILAQKWCVPADSLWGTISTKLKKELATPLKDSMIKPFSGEDASVESHKLEQISLDKNTTIGVTEPLSDIQTKLIAGEQVYFTASEVLTTSIVLDNGIKPLWPKDHPYSPGGLEQPWNFEQSLYYAKEWQDKGSYKLLPLTDFSQPDFNFIQKLYHLYIKADYEIDEVCLLSDEGDEQAFIAELDLLEKKHGSLVHQPKWKPKNQKIEYQETPDIVANRKVVREKLKAKRYRSQNVPHVKLLPLWQGISLEHIKNLHGASFNDLSYISDGELGKGYYGKDNAIVAYQTAYSKYGEQTLLVLSWYAGKVVYPVITSDSALKGQPHYANHDLHYSMRPEGYHEAVVFDPGQILPRYLISIKKSKVSSKIISELLKIPYLDPRKSLLLFQANFAQVIGQIAQHSFKIVHDWLSQENITNYLTIRDAGQKSVDYKYQDLIANFLQDTSKEVLLLKTADKMDTKILSRVIEATLWNNYQNGAAIPLHLKFSTMVKDDAIVEQSLVQYGIVEDAILDLKKHKKFTFIISYERSKRSQVLKANHINRQGGFSGKVLVVCSQAELDDSEDYLFYTEGGTYEQQRDRLKSYRISKLTEQQIAQQVAYISEVIRNNQILLPRKQYYAAKFTPSFNQKCKLLQSPGGELKPWEYCNELYYSPSWQDKGAFKIHQVKDDDPDYDFVAKMYKETAMPGYELDEVYVISDRGAEQAFVANLNTLERRSIKAEHQSDWQTEGHVELRQQIIDVLEQGSYKSLLAHSVKLLPLWHGTGPAAAGGIAKSGFASLALVDVGYFGKGLYGSSSAEYSYRVYAKGFGENTENKNKGYGEDGLLILGWYSAQNVYPVTKWDTHPGLSEEQDKLKGKANYKHYDSHFVLVKPSDTIKHEEGTEDAYYPIGEGEIDANTYSRICNFSYSTGATKIHIVFKRY